MLETHSSLPARLKPSEQTLCPKQMSAVIYFLLLIEECVCSGTAELRVWSGVAGGRAEALAGPVMLLPSSEIPESLANANSPGLRY